ncbi:MAG: hypothetical protein QNJ35_05335 [Paracoccaceae bacterium]|nr:hypothetical protein [Paracoccaceae bacterium]
MRGSFGLAEALVAQLSHLGHAPLAQQTERLEAYDFFPDTTEPGEKELEVIIYLAEVLQREDIDIT